MKKIFSAILICATALLNLSCSLGYYRNGQVIFKQSAIELSVQLYGKNSDKAYKQMVERLTALDDEISLTNENSKLSYFNEKAKADEKVEVSYDVYSMIEQGLLYEEETGGAFSIGVYNLCRLWQLDSKSIAKYLESAADFALPTIAKVKETLLDCDTGALKLTAQSDKYYIHKTNAALKIDLGAMAKGYCADLCYEIMKNNEIISGVVNISGNLIVLGKHYDSVTFTPWRMGVTDPRPRRTLLPRGDVCAISIEKDVSVVTSGDYERFFEHTSALTLCHIIDPRTGYPCGVVPSRPDDESSNGYRMTGEYVSSCTIIGEKSAKTDAYSTAGFVLGLDGTHNFLKGKQEKTDVIIFTERNNGAETHGRFLASDGVELYKTDEYGGYKSYERVLW